MTLEEMLEYTAAQYLDDRTVLVEGDSDELWSDSFLIRQFNEAQLILARRAWCIIEYGVSPAGIVTLSTGKALYPLHPSILKVYDATPITQQVPLGRTDDISQRAPYPPQTDAYSLGENAALAGLTLNQPGIPLTISTDAATKTMRVAPTPSADYNGIRVVLKIARLPLCDLELSKPNACPEVPKEWHLSLCEFAAGKALTLPNVDADQKPEGRRLLDQFDERVKEARRDRQRMEINDSRWGFSTATAQLGR